MKRKRFVKFGMLMFVLTSVALPQSSEPRSPFVFVHLGGFITAVDSFSRVFHSKVLFSYGVGVGFDLSSRSYLYGKFSYSSKSGVPVIRTYGQDNTVTETREGIATFKQWLINIGVEYGIFPSEDFTTTVCGGIAVIWITKAEQSSRASVSLIPFAAVERTVGFFGGVGLERNFQENPVTLFVEVQYNYIQRAAIGPFGGLSFDAGVRFYFKNRKRS